MDIPDELVNPLPKPYNSILSPEISNIKYFVGPPLKKFSVNFIPMFKVDPAEEFNRTKH